jgi:5-methylcytosine-specific restriction endonuclease McrA
MILTTTVLITLNSKTIDYYESLGYIIPRYKDRSYRLRVKKCTQIEVKVSDLLKGTSKVKVLCSCDLCGKEKMIVYNTIKEKYICQMCNNNLPEFRNNQIKKISGKNNINWNPNLTDKERKIRHCIPGIDKWRKLIKKRDNYQCQNCRSPKQIQVHHINNFSYFKEQRLDINNGITLCKDCHKHIHKLYGNFTNKQNLQEFFNN